MKTKIIFTGDGQYGDWKKGDTGFIEGFLYSDRPYMVIVVFRTQQPVLVPFGGTVKITGLEMNNEDIHFDYDKDEEGNMLSCCGDILDPDVMICKTCKEHN